MLQTLDSILGVVFVFLMFSLVVSAAREVVAAAMKLRNKNLKAGIDVLLTNLASQRLADDFWNHPFIKAVKSSKGPPSYMPAGNVAAALLHIVAGNRSGQATDMMQVKAGLAKIADTDLSTVIATAIKESGAGASIAQLEATLEGWVDDAMERISSLYQRKTRVWLFIIALILAVVMNVDTVTIWKRIQNDKVLRDALVAQAEKARPPEQNAAATPGEQPKADARAASGDANNAAKNQPLVLTKEAAEKYKKQLAEFTDLGLPIGWTNDALKLYDGPLAILLHICGLLASACAASLGAPFWFDLLQRIINVRSALKPKEEVEKTGKA